MLTSEGWQIVEDSAEAYERYLVPLLFAPGAEQLLELAELGQGERVFDVGCGTGIVARRAAQRVGENGAVAGLDVNEGMLQVARTASAGTRPAIDWRNGSATGLPFPDGAFDVVFCQQAVQFFSDRPAALREMHRVLDSRGRLALSVCRPLEYSPGYVSMVDVLDRYVGSEAAAMMRSPFPPWTLEQVRALLGDAGFRKVIVRIGVGTVRFPSCSEFLRREAACSPFAGTIAALSTEVRDAVVRDLGEMLRGHMDDDGVVFPIEIYFALGHR